LRVVRMNIPLIVIEGSGGLSDEIATAFQNSDNPIDDPLMAEIIADGELHFHHYQHSIKGIERLIIRELGSDKVLLQAWEAFANYDLNANLQQKRFNKLQVSIIVIGVVGVALVVVQQVFAPRNAEGDLLPVTFTTKMFGWWLIYYSLIFIPILLTIFLTAANRFKQGNKWLLLRAGAEAIKREIYKYRARAIQYTNNGEQHLSKAVEEITFRTMRTDVNLSALIPYPKDKGFPPYANPAQGGDDGFSCLTPDRYVQVRLWDQQSYFQRKTIGLEQQLRILHWLTFIVGGVGAFMAAIGLQAWVALTTSIVAALGTYLGYRQTENTLTKYNQAATDLANIKAWWDALSAEEQAQQRNINSLVEHTEQVLQSELDGWIQQMQNALADLRKTQEPSGDSTITEAFKHAREQKETTIIKVEEVSRKEETSLETETLVTETTSENTSEENETEKEDVEKIKPVGEFG
jgi:hypothetical protein